MSNEINKIIEEGQKFYFDLKNDKNGRYRSWEYCYKVFYDAHKSDYIDESYLDYLCLHLSFYLASWGMYRGSSFLLQKDYKIHKNVIKEIMNKKYNALWGIKVKEYKKEENQLILEELVESIKKIYNEIRLTVREKKPKNELSETLLTKVLMGTMGCVPAYDRYFISGIRKYNVANGIFNLKSILQLIDFYNNYYKEFETVRSKMNVGEIEYPQMKILDMCFWQVGFDLDNNKGLKIVH